ncbi:hypothetical protein GE107_12110 [Cohnella sp. CFH 77786]|uniref:hypothetical protein n=1 Tax=Cohnella sp. CFH 77786 TaxID=2662265 RepID=UPI001C60B9C9|nr:hypothetical protein [Cohnella sp. CFH 77786]MBW5446807.1 hypothetical protein [Cohnella sp. CFH 77786]
MASFFGSGPLPDWSEIRNWLGKDLPWKLVEQWEKQDDGEWLDKIVRGLMKDRPESAKMETSSLVQIDTVKNAKKLTVTVRLPNNTDMRSLRLFATSERLKVEGLPEQRIHAIRFPCRVFPRTGVAEQKEDRILIHFRRRPADREEVELFIRP